MSLLYFAVFAAVAWLWRPSDNNRRLAMSDELATDEDDLQDVEFDHLNHNKDDDDEEQGHLRRDEVVFDVRASAAIHSFEGNLESPRLSTL